KPDIGQRDNLLTDPARLFRNGALAGCSHSLAGAASETPDHGWRFCMIYGYAWDTSSTLSFAISILPILAIGLTVTMKAAATGFAIALVLGLVFALLRRSPYKIISWPTTIVVEFLRDTPLLVQLFFLYYVLPVYGIVLPAFLTGALALGLQYSAYTSEVYRGGIEAIPRGQWEAARALNLTTWRDRKSVVEG